MKIVVVACIVFLTLLNASKSDGQETPAPHVLNIIVILDTSDRVSHPGQIERDTKIVEKIVAQFVKVVKDHINRSKGLAYEGSLAVVVPNQPAVPLIEWQIMEKLTIPDPKDWNSIREMEESLEQQKNELLNAISQLYEVVVQHNQTGSDIWEWFKDEADRNIKKGTFIICLSDGYLNFDRKFEVRRLPGTYMQVRNLRDDPNWQQRIHDGKGLQPIGDGDKFSSRNVKFLMLEIVPQKDEYGIPYQRDFEIIKEYWKKWLNDMGIKNIEFAKKRGNLPSQWIESFISGESR